MGINIFEHRKAIVSFTKSEENLTEKFDAKEFKLLLKHTSFEAFNQIKTLPFNASSNCYAINQKEGQFHIKADYCIGLDWLGETKRYIHVEPKINMLSAQNFIKKVDSEDYIPDLKVQEKKSSESSCKFEEINYLKMFVEVLSLSETTKEINNLIKIDWDAPEISIKAKNDYLTPLLIVQFLNLLKSVVRKGLKKSYYNVQKNLNNQIKGKIMVGTNIKQNIFKNRLTNTYCSYQVFGEDNIENRFLKKVFHFVISYIENHHKIFNANLESVQQLIAYCRPAFEQIGNEIEERELKHIKYNPLFKEYKTAIKIGKQILRRFAYNISKTTDQTALIPPFWIDMPRLFELYVYQLLLKSNDQNSDKIKYQFSTYGNYLDFLIKNGKQSMVIDTKYKLHYNQGHLHSDIRQVAGYARLDKVLDEVSKGNGGFDKNDVLPCLIIYPDPNLKNCPSLQIENLITKDRKINAYHQVFKLGVPLPVINPSID